MSVLLGMVSSTKKRSRSNFMATMSSKRVKKTSNDHLDWWKNGFMMVQKVVSRQLVSQIDMSNAIGMPSMKDSKITRGFIEAQKRHPKNVIMMVIGEFCNSYGVGAIALVEYASLNAQCCQGVPTMRAGCQLSSIQQVVTSLISRGMTISLYSEILDENAVITRVLSNVLSPMCPFSMSLPTYRRKGLVVAPVDEDLLLVSKPCVFISDNVMHIVDMVCGSLLVQNDIDVQTACAHAVSVDSHITFAHPKCHKVVSRIMSDSNVIKGTWEQMLTWLKEEHHVLEELTPVESMRETRLPLSKSLLTQMNLSARPGLRNADIPPLLPILIGQSPVYVKAFLYNLIVTNPGRERAEFIRLTCQHVANGKIMVNEQNTIMATSSIITVLRQRNLHRQQRVLPFILRLVNNQPFDDSVYRAAGCASVDQEDLYTIGTMILSTLASETLLSQLPCPNDHAIGQWVAANSNYQLSIPQNELQQIKDIIDTVCKEARGWTWVFSSIDNTIYHESKNKMPDFVPAHNRKGRTVKNKWTKNIIVDNLVTLEKKFEDIRASERLRLDQIGMRLYQYVDTIRSVVQSHICIRAIHCHTSTAIRNRWVQGQYGHTIDAQGLIPHWLSQSPTLIENNIDIKPNATTLLTGPNASGKSSLVRSLLLACVLNNIGLYVPSRERFTSPFFDTFHLRLPCTDAPAQGLSSFAREAKDVGIILKNVTDKSIVFADELCRGTSHLEAVAISTSLLRHLNDIDVTTIFSTHLHSLLDILPAADRWTLSNEHEAYRGERRTSQALSVCRTMNWPSSIIRCTQSLIHNNDDDDDDDDDDSKQDDQKSEVGFDQLVQLAETTFAPIQAVRIGESELPPPFLLQSAALYIIDSEDGLYIGETNDTTRRRHEHRSRSDRKGRMAIMPCHGGKTQSMSFESQLIQLAQERQFALTSVVDGHHRI